MEMFLEIEVLFAAEGSKNKTDFAFYYFSVVLKILNKINLKFVKLFIPKKLSYLFENFENPSITKPLMFNLHFYLLKTFWWQPTN